MTAPEPVVLTDGERREVAQVFHGAQWLSPERAALIERILADRLAADRAVHEALRERVTSLAGVINLERMSRPESWETVEWLSGLVERIEDRLRAALAATTPPESAATEAKR